MARIRTIKPQFFFNEGLAALSPLTRLFFIGLWTQVDREGRCEDRPARLKATLFPYEDADVAEMILELIAYGHLVRYVADGVKILAIPNFLKHQRPHFKEDLSILPPPSAESMNEASMKHQCVIHEPSMKTKAVIDDSLKSLNETQEGKGMEGNRKGTVTAPLAHEPEFEVVKPLTAVQRVVEAYKHAKNVDMKDKAWDKCNYGRAAKAAQNLLACWGGDVEKSAKYIFLRGEDLNESDLTWTLETIARHAFDGIGIPKNEEHGPKLEQVGAVGLDGKGRNKRLTSSGEIARDALRHLEHAALHPERARDLDGPSEDSRGHDEDFS